MLDSFHEEGFYLAGEVKKESFRRSLVTSGVENHERYDYVAFFVAPLEISFRTQALSEAWKLQVQEDWMKLCRVAKELGYLNKSQICDKTSSEGLMKGEA